MVGHTLAEALAAAGLDRAVLAHLAGPIGAAARAAAGDLASLSPEAQRGRRAAWAAAVRAPVPPGLRGVDGSWIEAALAGLPPAARRAVASVTDDPVTIWLARWACASIPPMPAIEPALVVPRTAGEVGRLSPAALRAWLAEVGTDQLAFALGDQAARAVGVFGAALGRAAARIGRAPRAGELGTRRHAIERARVAPGPLALLQIGARALAPHLDPVAHRQLALRCDRATGLALLAELRAFGNLPVAESPSWKALAASVTTER